MNELWRNKILVAFGLLRQCECPNNNTAEEFIRIVHPAAKKQNDFLLAHSHFSKIDNSV